MLDGPFAKRKFWGLYTLNGVTENHAESGRISRKLIRAMLDSAHGFKFADTSEEARKARAIEDFGALNGLRFPVRIGVEPPKGTYKAKNKIDEVITPDRQNWRRVEQLPSEQRVATTAAPVTATTAAPANAVDRPKWAGPSQSPTQ